MRGRTLFDFQLSRDGKVLLGPEDTHSFPEYWGLWRFGERQPFARLRVDRFGMHHEPRFTDDGRYVIYAPGQVGDVPWEQDQTRSNVLHVLDSSSGKLLCEVAAPPGHFSIEAKTSPRGRYLVMGDMNVRVVDVHGGGITLDLPALSMVECVFSPDETMLLVSSPTNVAIWDLGSCTLICERPQRQSETKALYPGLHAFVTGGALVASLTDDQEVLLWHPARTAPTEARLRLGRKADYLRASPQGHWLAVVSSSGSAQLWDVSKRPPAPGPLLQVDSVAAISEESPPAVITPLGVLDAETGILLRAAAPMHGVLGVIPYVRFAETTHHRSFAGNQSSHVSWTDLSTVDALLPEWFLDAVENLVGRQFEGVILKDRVDARVLIEARVHARMLDEQTRVNCFLKWFFGNRWESPVTPLSTVTTSQYVQRLLNLGGKANVAAAYRLTPGDARACALWLCEEITWAVPEQASRKACEWEYLSERATRLGPKIPETWIARALANIAAGRWNEAWTHAQQAAELKPERAALWQVLVEAFIRHNRTEEAVTLCSLGITMTETNAPPMPLLREGLLDLQAQAWETAGNHREADRCRIRKRIPLRSGHLSERQIDLGGSYNAALHDDWTGSESQWFRPEGLAQLPTGVVTLAQIPFDVRGIVQLQSTQLGSTHAYTMKQGQDTETSWTTFEYGYPQKVDDISIGRTCHRLHFLHATIGRETGGRELGAYVIHYADGTTVRLPIKYGVDMSQWVAPAGLWTEVFQPKPAWISPQEDAAGTRRHYRKRLYVQSWLNPAPEVHITSLDFTSTLTRSAPFLIAVTVD